MFGQVVLASAKGELDEAEAIGVGSFRMLEELQTPFDDSRMVGFFRGIPEGT